ncbi:MAG: 50S ribosomal protein L17 [Myxococcota bacterium]
MRHQKAGRRLGRTSSHRTAMFRNMVTSLFEHGRIRTTDQKAKELRQVADRMVTLGKKNTVHARRLAARTIQDRVVLAKLFDEIAPGFEERHGGYTRIIKIGRRRGDNAMMSFIELMPAGAPDKKARRRPVAPSVKPTTAVPETKERFDVTSEAEEEGETAEEPKAEEPTEEAKAEEPTEEAKAEEPTEAAEGATPEAEEEEKSES